jgi:MFS family permease
LKLTEFSSLQNARIIYLLAFFGDLALSVQITSTILLGTMLGFSTFEVGLIGSAYGLCYLASPAILGKIGDKVPRKTSILIATIGQTLLAIYFLSILSLQGNLLLILIILGNASYGIFFGFFWPSVEAYVSETLGTTPKAHEHAICNFCLSWSLGFAVGPYIAGFFSDMEIKWAFLVNLIAFTFTLISTLIFLPNTKQYSKDLPTAKEKSEKETKTDPRAIQLTILILMGSMTYAVLSKVLMNYFPNYAVMPTGLGWSGTLTGQVLLFFGLGRTLYFLIGRFLNNALKAIEQSFFIIMLLFLSLIWLKTPLSLGILMFIAGLFVGRIYFVSLELLLKNENQGKGAKAGLFESAIGMGSGLSPLIAGALATVTLWFPFMIFSMFAVVFLVIFHLKSKQFN